MIWDKVALITGSTSGIGRELAILLNSKGYRIIVHSRKTKNEGIKLAMQLDKSVYVLADLSKEDETRRLVKTVKSKFNRLDLLINNAGHSVTIPHGNLKDATPDIWREINEVNVISPWILISEFEDLLKASSTPESPSSIINISSHAGVRPKGASIPYAVSKASLNHMTKLLAKTLAPEIRVNALAPGLVDTPMSKDWDDAKELWKNNSPMKRSATPKDIADLAYMVTKSNYLTGEVIVCDGGLNLT